MSTFKHTPFDLERPGIRLLRLLKGEDSLIECELFQAWHDGDDTDYIPYEALSYTWGGMEMAASVRIATQTHGVTENLYLALQHLRYRDEDRILWVDAICIDQSNSKERGHQVNQMRTIYTRADRVLIWLGPASDDAYVLLDSLKRLEQRSKRNWSLEDKRWPETWQSIWKTIIGSPASPKSRSGVIVAATMVQKSMDFARDRQREQGHDMLRNKICISACICHRTEACEPVSRATCSSCLGHHARLVEGKLVVEQ
jgi:hypothetical protein